MMAIKRIMRYDYGLWYKKGGNLELKTLTNADWVENIDDKKITSGGAFFLGKRLVSWTSKKKIYISHSTEEEKYVAIVVNYSNIVLFKQLMACMEIEIKDPVVIY